MLEPVLALLAAFGDQVRQMLGAHHGDAGGLAGGGQLVAFPADAGMDMQQRGADLRQPALKPAGIADRHGIERSQPGALEIVCGRAGVGKSKYHCEFGREPLPEHQHVLADAGRDRAVAGEHDRAIGAVMPDRPAHEAASTGAMPAVPLLMRRNVASAWPTTWSIL